MFPLLLLIARTRNRMSLFGVVEVLVLIYGIHTVFLFGNCGLPI